MEFPAIQLLPSDWLCEIEEKFGENCTASCSDAFSSFLTGFRYFDCIFLGFCIVFAILDSFLIRVYELLREVVFKIRRLRNRSGNVRNTVSSRRLQLRTRLILLVIFLLLSDITFIVMLQQETFSAIGRSRPLIIFSVSSSLQYGMVALGVAVCQSTFASNFTPAKHKMKPIGSFMLLFLVCGNAAVCLYASTGYVNGSIRNYSDGIRIGLLSATFTSFALLPYWKRYAGSFVKSLQEAIEFETHSTPMLQTLLKNLKLTDFVLTQLLASCIVNFLLLSTTNLLQSCFAQLVIIVFNGAAVLVPANICILMFLHRKQQSIFARKTRTAVAASTGLTQEMFPSKIASQSLAPDY